MEAQGTVALTTTRGSINGSITIDAGSGDCKISITLALPGGPRTVTAILNGKRTRVEAPAGLGAAALLPLGTRLGCPLVAPRAARGLALALEPGTGRAATLGWKRLTAAGSHTLQLAYRYGSMGAYPVQVTETVDGATRLVVRFTSAAAHNFTAADFALPPPRRPAAAGGAQ